MIALWFINSNIYLEQTTQNIGGTKERERARVDKRRQERDGQPIEHVHRACKTSSSFSENNSTGPARPAVQTTPTGTRSIFIIINDAIGPRHGRRRAMSSPHVHFQPIRTGILSFTSFDRTWIADFSPTRPCASFSLEVARQVTQRMYTC
jgi:hypothetical protein